MQYIKEIALKLKEVSRTSPGGPTWQALLDGLNQELETLSARDFFPAARFKFVYYRKMLRQMPMLSQPVGVEILDSMLQLLDAFGGEGSFAVRRSFAFVSDADLRGIIERDYNELALTLFPSGAWKSVVIMAGSILEAIIYDALTADPEVSAAAERATRAPKRGDGTVKQLAKTEWSLSDLIKVAVDVGLIPKEREATVDQALRDYRNFVHPKKELRAAHSCSEAEALVAKGALDGLLNHLSRRAT